jgi:hypothetical protein
VGDVGEIVGEIEPLSELHGSVGDDAVRVRDWPFRSAVEVVLDSAVFTPSLTSR